MQQINTTRYNGHKQFKQNIITENGNIMGSDKMKNCIISFHPIKV